MLRLFRGTCEAVRAMHTFRTTKSSQTQASTSAQRRVESIPASARPRTKQTGKLGGSVVHHGSDDEDEDDLLPHPEGDGEGGYSYGNDGGSSVPLVTKHAIEDEGEIVFDGDEELASQEPNGGDPSPMEVVPYAHRDLKPGYECLIYSLPQLT